MARSPVLIYLIVVVFVLLLLSFAPKRPNRPHRRLKLRPAADLSDQTARDRDRRGIPFDPVIADIERRREDREWERAHFLPQGHAPAMEAQPEWEDFMDAEDYINDEERFNVTDRIVLLFPKIDVAPADGFVSSDELADWNLRQVEKEVMHRTQRDMELHDKNHDGFISFKEYEPPSWARRYHDDNATDDKVGWWKEEHFNASDMDGDGLLNLTEFNDFLHPADTNNPKLIHWLSKEEIRERDKDKDGKLNFQEYFNGLFDLIRKEDVYNVTYESDSSTDAPAKRLFSQLDHNNDGYLSEDELIPVIGDLHPSERYYAKQQADYVISEPECVPLVGKSSFLQVIIIDGSSEHVKCVCKVAAIRF
ncbi:calcium-binding EF hand family protein [Musa troglodytarum]|uniref:Calcium-binding EF hand family protein n=1 Tax=Musa troglodytarum TaxID=320322 RepID=A0A9E7I0S1_9LILI|nr:calcium-binding EF hand family protein [Musa troglodytarum]